jgi:type II secretory pathway predicted ATPase ExeA
MYANFFGLTGEPFHITPDLDFLFLSSSHKNALDSVINGIERRAGLILLTGDVGLGKTTVLRSFLAQIDKDKHRPIVILNPNISFADLVKCICEQLDLERQDTADSAIFIDFFRTVLAEEHKHNRRIVLIIDEAQNVPLETLERLSLLLDLESPQGKLVQILLVGQTELEEKLKSKELRRLEQCVAVRSKLSALSVPESVEYINYRLSKVSTSNKPVLTKSALEMIVKNCEGVPRKINILCDNVLIAGFGSQTKPVSHKIVREVISDFYGLPSPKKRSKVIFIPAFGLTLSAVLLLWALGGNISTTISQPETSSSLPPSSFQNTSGPLLNEQNPETSSSEPNTQPISDILTETIPLSASAIEQELSITQSSIMIQGDNAASSGEKTSEDYAGDVFEPSSTQNLLSPSDINISDSGKPPDSAALSDPEEPPHDSVEAKADPSPEPLGEEVPDEISAAPSAADTPVEEQVSISQPVHEPVKAEPKEPVELEQPGGKQEGDLGEIIDALINRRVKNK